MEVSIEQLQAELQAEKAKNAELLGRIDALENKFDIKKYLERRTANDKEEQGYKESLEASFC
jgi:hypothetical protein